MVPACPSAPGTPSRHFSDERLEALESLGPRRAIGLHDGSTMSPGSEAETVPRTEPDRAGTVRTGADTAGQVPRRDTGWGAVGLTRKWPGPLVLGSTSRVCTWVAAVLVANDSTRRLGSGPEARVGLSAIVAQRGIGFIDQTEDLRVFRDKQEIANGIPGPAAA